MRLSFSTAAENMDKLSDDKKDLMGYSHASYQILKTLREFGFSTSVLDSEAPVGISMGFPTDYKFYPDQYKIGYTAWESTQLKEGWLEKMLSVDELWATSSWTAEVFKEATGREDVHVYPHGIDFSWSPKKRSRGEVFRFLHVGEPQARKNGQLTVEAFIDLFGNDPKYQLIMKCTNINTTRIFHEDGTIAGGPDGRYKNIKIITQEFSHKTMVDMFHTANALIYPTTGEGFGFIPLQALATGMPVATTTPWAEYEKFITVPIPSLQGSSDIQQIHPGNVYNICKKDIKKSMIDIVENYEKYRQQSYKNSFKVHMEYDWKVVTDSTSKRLKNIFKTRGF